MARFTYVMAEFVGDMHYFDFVKGNIYPLEVRQGLFGSLQITPCHGYEWKPFMEYRHGFRDLHSFLHAWKITSLEHPNAFGFQQVPRPDKPDVII